jgi:hypothetical protein
MRLSGGSINADLSHMSPARLTATDQKLFLCDLCVSANFAITYQKQVSLPLQARRSPFGFRYQELAIHHRNRRWPGAMRGSRGAGMVWASELGHAAEGNDGDGCVRLLVAIGT